MTVRQQLDALIHPVAGGGGVVLLDGSIGMELGRRGVDLTGPLWSAGANLTRPELVFELHRDFLAAGAALVTTNTFRAHRRALPVGSDSRVVDEVVAAGVEAACSARDAINPQALVFGSIGPLEDCYTPHRAPDDSTCHREHAEQIERMLSAGVDAVVLETMGTRREAVAAAQEAARLAPDRWVLSMIVRGESSDASTRGVLLSGEPVTSVIDDLGDALAGALAVGLNCVPAPKLAGEFDLLQSLVGPRMRLLASANVGEPDGRGGWRPTDATDPQRYAAYAEQWIGVGMAENEDERGDKPARPAMIIGGCCGTGPATIRALAAQWSIKPAASSGRAL